MRAFAIAVAVAAGLALTSFNSFDRARAQSSANELEAKPIGKVVTANGSVRIEHTAPVVVQVATGGNDQVKIGDFVYQGDVVQTGAGSAVGIVFLDGSAFNLASNARITLNEFVYAPNRNTNSTFFNLSKGTLTFVASYARKLVTA
ncbi:MAG: FecR domain-containing protein [Xanthobacteraceae bacterium]